MNRLFYYYHTGMTILSILAGYAFIAVGIFSEYPNDTILMRIFLTLLFWMMGTACFLIAPAAFIAVGVLVRFFAFIPLLEGNHQWHYIFLAAWSAFNIASIFGAYKFKKGAEGEIMPPFILI